MRTKMYLLCVATAVSACAFNGPVMGWSSWNTYRVNISDSLIMSQADKLIELGLDSMGFNHVNIDDGFFGGRSADGTLQFHPQRFPRGMKRVVDHIHALGLKAGIYSDAGANTCGNFYDNDTIARGVGLYGHEEQDCNLLFSDLGFDFIKVDFCGGDLRQNSDSLSLDPEQSYRRIRAAIEGTGRNDVEMNVCRWDFPGVWASDIASSWRISHDISPSWWSVRDIIAQNLYLSAYAGSGHYNDMDMLELGRGLSADEERTHFGIWCIMSSPLLIGCDLGALPQSTLSLLRNKDLIALNQDTLGLQAYVASRRGGCYVLVKDVETQHGVSRAVAFYNSSDSAARISLRFADVELGGKVAAKNLFDGRKEVFACDSMSVEVAPHSTEIFRLEAESRLMRRRYEAETAYLTAYQELVNPNVAKSAYYAPDSICSGGMKVVNAGGAPGNDMVFKNVYVPEDMTVTVTVRCRPVANGTGFTLAVNVDDVGERNFTSAGVFEDIAFKTVLRKGSNTIRLYNLTDPMPEIDYIDITGFGEK